MTSVLLYGNNWQAKIYYLHRVRTCPRRPTSVRRRMARSRRRSWRRRPALVSRSSAWRPIWSSNCRRDGSVHCGDQTSCRRTNRRRMPQRLATRPCWISRCARPPDRYVNRRKWVWWLERRRWTVWPRWCRPAAPSPSGTRSDSHCPSPRRPWRHLLAVPTLSTDRRSTIQSQAAR